MTLPAQVKVISEIGQTRLILPIRARTPRVAALVPIVFGLIFSGFAIFWMLGASGILERRVAPAPVQVVPGGVEGPEAPARPAAAPERARGLEWDRLLFALFGIPFFVVGLIPIGLGILGMFESHAELCVTAEELTAVDHMGPVRFRRRRQIKEIAKLRVGTAFERSESQSAGNPNYVLFLETTSNADEAARPAMRLVARYPREMLIGVADALLEEIMRRGSTAILHGDARGVTVSVDPEPAAASEAGAIVEEPPMPQPAGSSIQFIQEADALTFIIPRTGFRGTALFFLIFSLFWDGLSFTFFGVMLVALIREPSWENLGVLAFLSIFVFVGVCTLLAGIQFAFRRAVIIASRESLVFTQTGPVRKSDDEWTPGELTKIFCGNSNTTVNGRVLQELKIFAGEKKRAIFQGRDEDELRWLASVLRRFYQVCA